MSGLSGARVLVLGNIALKLAPRSPARTVEQGLWLQTNADRNLPHVKQIMPSGYLMERLVPIDTGDVDLQKLVDALSDSVWRYAPVNLVDTAQTLTKISKILDTYAPELVQPAIKQLCYIRTTQDCLTHGDPTAENVMRRRDIAGSTYVIIDPLPSTSSVPDDVAVDIGKLLQSAHGWEAMKGEEPANWQPEDVAKLFAPDLYEVGHLWCIVHFIRTLPYAPEEVRPHVLNKITQLLGV